MTITTHARPWTYRDLEAFPDNGNRYEIIEGSLHVTPPASVQHQSVVGRLTFVLTGPGEARGLRALPGAGVLTGPSYLIPDLLLARAEALAKAPVSLAPAEVALVVEVVSPSSATHDQVTKRAAYAAAGIAHYWVVDCSEGEQIVALALQDQAYVEVGRARGAEELTLTEPVALTVSPAYLYG